MMIDQLQYNIHGSNDRPMDFVGWLIDILHQKLYEANDEKEGSTHTHVLGRKLRNQKFNAKLNFETFRDISSL
jgi:hypothetical protein